MALRNPVIYGNRFERSPDHDYGQSMTLAGAAGKALILTVLLVASAAYTWYLFFNGQDVSGFLKVGLIGSLVIALPTIFFPRISPFTAPLYVIVNGLLYGAVSAMGEYLYPGIVMNAILITLSLFLITLFLYATRIIRVTPGLVAAISIATLAIALTYLVNFILSFFGMSVPYIHDTGWVGIAISAFVIVIATSNLLIDFSNIEQYANEGRPKYMEWYGAFGLMVTIIWMYFEILRLLAKLASSRN
ncbi:Bax inhibitor-1/YccA family protein [Paenibacillus hunanensis]|uniref:Bax inhibitor-1/YccA family protein n=1 Tax=Paenibacillus hunanensis TaxID=539262 RepID=UPI002A6AB7F8|nr:Bax inhibitor-1/YccA family protein [Paenibacillus hunanensis]WPP40274.1 Bax inhibitor-1/YccA family protein [Paenibacillus hunanensis]